MEKELPPSSSSSSPFRSRPVGRPRLVTLIILGVCTAVALSTALQLLLVDYFAVRYARQEAQLRLQQLSWQMRDVLNHVMEEAATVQLSASIGVAVHVAERGEDLDALLARADGAMYQAKRQGKNNVVMASAVNWQMLAGRAGRRHTGPAARLWR